MTDISPSADTVGVKYDAGKLRYDLIPAEALEELARVYTIGAVKYSDNNWRHGLVYSRLFGALMRHAWAWMRGESHDPDGQHHLASVAWCALALLQFEIEKRSALDDRWTGQ